MLEIVAPHVGGVEASDGSWIAAVQKIDGGPSVLYDAVALLPSEEGATALAKEPAARDFVADAFAHMKFIGYVAAALPLVSRRGMYGARRIGRRGAVYCLLPSAALLGPRGGYYASVAVRGVP